MPSRILVQREVDRIHLAPGARQSHCGADGGRDGRVQSPWPYWSIRATEPNTYPKSNPTANDQLSRLLAELGLTCRNTYSAALS
jgi:hypothetical protein